MACDFSAVCPPVKGLKSYGSQTAQRGCTDEHFFPAGTVRCRRVRRRGSPVCGYPRRHGFPVLAGAAVQSGGYGQFAVFERERVCRKSPVYRPARPAAQRHDYRAGGKSVPLFRQPLYSGLCFCRRKERGDSACGLCTVRCTAAGKGRRFCGRKPVGGAVCAVYGSEGTAERCALVGVAG